jgi:hypothetical protein
MRFLYTINLYIFYEPCSFVRFYTAACQSLVKALHSTSALASSRTHKKVLPPIIPQNSPHARLKPLRISPETPARLKTQPVYKRNLPVANKRLPLILSTTNYFEIFPIPSQQPLLTLLHRQHVRNISRRHEHVQRHRASEEFRQIADAKSETDVLEVVERYGVACRGGEEFSDLTSPWMRVW